MRWLATSLGDRQPGKFFTGPLAKTDVPRYIKTMPQGIDNRLDRERIGVLEVTTMLIRNDPFRDLDRFTQQVFGTAARPAVMPMDAWRDGEQFVVELDLPGIDEQSLDLDIERNVVTVRAERPDGDPNREMLATERARGVFSRQLVLGDNLDTDHIDARYGAGVLRLCIPVAEKAKPRKIAVERGNRRQTAISA